MGSMGADFLVQALASGPAIEPFTSGAGSDFEAQASASGPDSEPFTSDIEWTTAWQRLSDLDAPLVWCNHMFGMPVKLNTAKALNQTTAIPIHTSHQDCSAPVQVLAPPLTDTISLLFKIQSNTFSLGIHQAEIELRPCISLRRSEPIPFLCFFEILGNARRDTKGDLE
jgi:hypothetical protein